MNDNILHRSLMGSGKEKPLTIEDFVTIEALEDGLTAKLSRNACEYCIDGSMEWVSLAANTATPAINAGQTLSFRATNPSISSSYGMGTFTISHRCNLSGNCMSMLYGDYARLKTAISSSYAFYKLFYGCAKIESVAKSFLPATTLSTACYKYMFYGCTSLVDAPSLPSAIAPGSSYSYMFYNCTSLTEAPALPAMELAMRCYSYMFYDCKALNSAPALPATTLVYSCYGYMFYNCSSLTEAPALPALTLTSECYYYMFYGCSSLTAAPELPATTLATYCYKYMFYGCKKITVAPPLPVTLLQKECYNHMFAACSLTKAPELPATTLAEGCYSYMFNACPLTEAPELPALTMVKDCYSGMFYGCSSSLTSAPLLPSTELAENCYQYMFYGCKSLTAAPELPATTLADSCYYGMFYGCTSLTEAPSLPSTELAEFCYGFMFNGCSNLTEAPELPAATLTTNCYREMFRSCTSLVNAPELLAKTLTPGCYYSMFYGCWNMNRITMLATNISASECMTYWVLGVATSGTFIKNIEAEWESVGSSGVPSGWEIVYDRTPIECLSLTITADDVGARATTTIIHYTATVLAQDPEGNVVQTTISKDVVSDEFPQNTSETETVTREISFTYMGVTATTTITQGVWVNQYYAVELNNQWQLSSEIANPDSTVYEGVYESFANKGLDSHAAIMYIDIIGYETFKLYIRSYAESSYDYVMVSQLDQAIDNNTSYSITTLVKAHTRGSQSSGTAISNYNLVEFTGIDGGEHRITIAYRKDGSGASGTDRGYVLIPINQ